MCGRFTLFSNKVDIETTFSAPIAPSIHYKPSWNIAPGKLVLGLDNTTNAFTLNFWGLKLSENSNVTPINLRIETIRSNKFFNSLYRNNRIIIPANGFYEWKTVVSSASRSREPYYFHFQDMSVFCFAGLYFTSSNSSQKSFALITIPARPPVSEIHNRQPVVLKPNYATSWLLGQSNSLSELIDAFSDSSLSFYPVSKAVNYAKKDSPGLIEPMFKDSNHGRNLHTLF